MRIRNLTGHTINVVFQNGTLIKTLEPDNIYSQLKANTNVLSSFVIDDMMITQVSYSLSLTFKEMKELSNSCDAILVSKIVADELKKMKYKGMILIPGRKVYKDRSLVGVSELSIY